METQTFILSKNNSTTEVVPFNEDPEKVSKKKDRKLKLIEKLKNKRQGVDEKENTDFQVYACTGLLVVLCLVVVVIKVFLEEMHYEEPSSAFLPMVQRTNGRFKKEHLKHTDSAYQKCFRYAGNGYLNPDYEGMEKSKNKNKTISNKNDT